MKLKPFRYMNETPATSSPLGFWVFCPGCKCGHPIYVRGANQWQFNGDHDRPSFSPSLLVYPNSAGQKRCHSFIVDGKWQFLADCEHELANQTVEIPDYPEDEWP